MVNLICFKIPRTLDVRSLHILTLSLWLCFLVLVVRAAVVWFYLYYFMVQLLACDLEFRWDLHQDIAWNNYSWGQYSMLSHSLRYVAQDLSILWGIFPSLINVTVENSSSKTIWNWGETWSVAGFRTRATDLE